LHEIGRGTIEAQALHRRGDGFAAQGAQDAMPMMRRQTGDLGKPAQVELVIEMIDDIGNDAAHPLLVAPPADRAGHVQAASRHCR
jgi:hypothetical protein